MRKKAKMMLLIVIIVAYLTEIMVSAHKEWEKE